jgi:membrane associated rhomboid family serine protease
VPPPLRPASEGIDAALIFAALLVVAHVAAVRQLFGIDWTEIGYAGTGLIRDGQWWRAITALSLHADFGHLASNVVAGAALGIFVSQVLGPGLTWLAIILSGGLGNGLNALVQPATHASVGASTAVFAALGMLSALMWRRALPLWRRGLRRRLPLAAGVALLAILGTGGERTDLGAHAFGFIVGIGTGVGLHLAAGRIPAGKGAQIAYGAAALALWVATWLLAVANA